MKKKIILLLLFTILPTLAQEMGSNTRYPAFENQSQLNEKPPLSGGKIAVQLLTGGAGAFLGSVAGAYAGAALIGPEGGEDPGLVGAFVGLFVGSTLGSSLGVYFSGRTGNQSGSYAGTLLGSTLGMLVFLVALPDPDGSLFFAGLYGLSTAGGVIGFNASRRYRLSPASATGLLNIGDGQFNVAVPNMAVRPNPFDRKDFISTVDLVRINL